MHPTAESSSAPWSQKLAKCLFWSEILRLLFLCDALRNYYEIYTASQKLFKKSFLLQTDVTNSKARKQTFSKKSDSDSGVCIIQQSQASRCASHRGVKLHSAESNCTPRSQNRKFHWSLVAFKGTIMRDPFRGEQFYQKRKDLKYNKWIYLTKNFNSAVSCTTRSWIFLTLWSNISVKSKPIRKYFILFIPWHTSSLSSYWNKIYPLIYLFPKLVLE